MQTLRASKNGLTWIKKSRNQKGWTVDSDKWLLEATKILEPNRKDGQPFAEGISEGTWKRFLAGKYPINANAFRAYCQVLSLNWEEVIDKTNPEDRTGIWIPNLRCRRVWGREILTTEVLNYLKDPQQPLILSLNGTAGYGKTEAACQIAQTALEQNLFAEVLWVTARQSEFVDGTLSQTNQDDTLTWNQFINQIAHQLSCTQQKVQEKLREKKTLVVLDNAETSNIEEILPRLVKMLNPSRALLTSRIEKKVPYLGLKHVPGLEQRWSYALLQDEAKNNNISALLNASERNLQRIYELSCGAPLALHFIVGRVWYDEDLEPVLSSLEEASGEVENFYKFSLETAWKHLNDSAKNVLRYMGQQADAGITLDELLGTQKIERSDWCVAKRELKQWYLIQNVTDVEGNYRYDLHPWVRRSLRSGLVDNWQPDLQELENIAQWKLGINW
ncbi:MULTISPECIES: NB-ARC domain-containing protein [unclassified Roseofilum]|uniref:NB-ARC domain-containing protein n=1 Tax=unclassified Roseofilum TaxID=2620099 RepID=UPI001B14DF89|nr:MULTISPECIES: NB-ARC domain-containing protein [unclassified Roseofilum]MBP0008884.1 hypothetical protein [Roseofilum sp. Belize Diploria]MBP0033282.1 hypothetical protein [Roseofilum sp. Belize BBD 4]